MTIGAKLIEAERLNQIYRHGYTLETDAEHGDNQLAEVAAIIAAQGTPIEMGNVDDWGIMRKHAGNRLSQLAIAGALIAAEIDRLADDLIGVDLITAERLKQIYRNGYDASNDAEHTAGELAAVAAIVVAAGTLQADAYSAGVFDDWNILTKHHGDRISQLTIAGALIAAELDRLLDDGIMV